MKKGKIVVHPGCSEISIPVGENSIRMMVPGQEKDSSERLTFWWGITSAAIALAKHVQSFEIGGKQAIELGCGLGLAGVTAGLCGAEVLFTDFMPKALNFADKNARLNGLHNFATGFLDWEQPGSIGKFDLILGSEILYDYFFHGSLIELFRKILNPEGTILLADRKRLCVSRFIGRMNYAGFISEEFTEHVQVQGFPDQEISIFSLKLST
ncbi:class I SAM-dependent methyltransferase [Desulfomonile tiedjei]|uniref:Putative methyltransferase n=1 Tax=Desulfomonile tiedjei (strain ATCC 49306 / DSM 6799 / DCB-1) TaxID=706587 RepID=I4C8N6_DESTA|nr:methyltransferase domain-containing protein [Desulfomonile tiedjei]AFM25927.1 putative methyltransferase [Desulfomonile tiedjei DSM 6799]